MLGRNFDFHVGQHDYNLTNNFKIATKTDMLTSNLPLNSDPTSSKVSIDSLNAKVTHKKM